MSFGELSTRATIWLSLLSYATTVCLLLHPGRPQHLKMARWFWTLGCTTLALHAICAFHWYYSWSHAAAVQQTAAQTKQTLGIAVGSGLYVNYLCIVVWLVDCLWWWRQGDAAYMQRRSWIHAFLHAFLIFMIINGAIVFGDGPVRLLGAGVLAAIGVCWVRRQPSR